MLLTALIPVFLILHTNAYENIALHKPAWQEFPNNSQSGDASKAVDGELGSVTDMGEHCTISADNKKKATWRVDLQQILPIYYVDIHYSPAIRNGSPVIDQLAGYMLYVSNTTNKDDGVLCTYYYYRRFDPSLRNITCPNKSPVYGRYVIYYNQRRSDIRYPGNYSDFAYNDLCEVEVYGCSRQDSVGENCSAPCPDYCEHCHNNGSCLVCKDDLAGPFCNKSEPEAQIQTSGFPLYIILPVVSGSHVVLILSVVVIVQRRKILKRRKEEKDREGYMTYRTEINTYDMLHYRVNMGDEETSAHYEHVS